MNLLSAARHQTDETYADHPADRSPCHGKGHLLRGRAALYSPAEGVVLAFPAYAGSLLAMLAFVAGSVTVSWADLDVAARLTFAGLMGLGLYMLWRANQARARLRRQDPGWCPKCLDDVGLTLISLFGGFVIAGAIDLGLRVGLVVAAAVSGVVVGAQAMQQVKSRLVATSGATRPARDLPGSPVRGGG